MSEMMENFEALLDASFMPIQNGDMREGTVLEIGPEAAVVDVGSYMDGILSKDQLPEGEALSDLIKGQKIQVTVKRVDTRNSQILLSKREADRVQHFRQLGRYLETGEAVYAKVEAAVKGGLRIRIGETRGFVPASQVDTSYTEDLSVFAGTEIKVRVLEINEERREFTASRKEVLLREAEENKKKYFSRLEIGDSVQGEVVRLAPYGAFVRLAEGVTGLIHISDLSWKHVKTPEEVVKIGDLIDAEVLEIDRKEEKLKLSLKALGQDPYMALPFAVGDVLAEKEVRRIIPKGAFLRLTDMIEGFLPISELSERRVERVREVVKEGEKVAVRVIQIDADRHRITLSMKGIDQESGELMPEGISFYSTDEEEEGSALTHTAFGNALGSVLGNLDLDEGKR